MHFLSPLIALHFFTLFCSEVIFNYTAIVTYNTALHIIRSNNHETSHWITWHHITPSAPYIRTPHIISPHITSFFISLQCSAAQYITLPYLLHNIIPHGTALHFTSHLIISIYHLQFLNSFHLSISLNKIAVTTIRLIFVFFWKIFHGNWLISVVLTADFELRKNYSGVWLWPQQ